jgi:TonB family protein
MPRARWWTTTLLPPVVYLAMVIVATRQPSLVYRSMSHTVVTVSDTGGPAALHSRPVVYPAKALAAGVAGKVTVEVEIGADGTVARADAVAGPPVLRAAAAEGVREWQFEAKAQHTTVEVNFSPETATRSLTPPRVVRRFAVPYRGKLGGTVRVVAVVDERGTVEFVQPVGGPESLAPLALESVWHWTFQPMVRNGRAERGTVVVDVKFVP